MPVKGFPPTFRPIHYVGGIFVVLFLLLLCGSALFALFSAQGEYGWQALRHDTYLHHVLQFSVWQALLSASLSVFVGFWVARAFFYQTFKGKKWMLRLFSLTFVLPSLVAIFGLLGVYGGSGWLAKLSTLLGWDWVPNIYGLSGILLAHLFFNIPLACNLFLQGLQSIPVQQRQLAAQLNLRGWRFIRVIEFPYLRQQGLSVFSLIFMLCFTSFAIVLTLGGGPKYTTLEVAIYQAILFEFDLPKAALLALLQFILCFALFALSHVFTKSPSTVLHNQAPWFDKQKSAVQFWQVLLILCTSVFVLLPLLNTLLSAFFSEKFFSVWTQSSLWRALGYSLLMAPTSAFLALLMALALLIMTRRLAWLHYPVLAQSLLSIGAMILAIPTLVLAIGLFILLKDIDFSTLHLFMLVVCCNALMAMPFVLRILAVPMHNNMMYYEKLCASLHIQGWQRMKLIEWYQLRAPMKYAFALACALSLGDFTAIALFGQQDFTSLPHLLYQQLGNYRSQEAAVTAFVLLLLCIAIFFVIEHQKEEQHD